MNFYSAMDIWDNAMKYLKEAKTFHALGDKRRLEIYELVREAGAKGIRPNAMLEYISIKPHALSQQLHILLKAGLVSRRIKGAAYYYLPNTSALDTQLPILEINDE